MEKFQLSLLFKIIGIGSASGLAYHNDNLYLISDNSTFLYEYNIPSEKLNKIALVENAQNNIAKKDKPDFEAIWLKKNMVLVIGSGSTSNRNQAFQYSPEFKKVEKKDYSNLYQKIKKHTGLKDDELNIEGFFITGKDAYFFQRGNGNLGKNSIIFIRNSRSDFKLEFTPFDLPKIKNIPTTFTDAVLVDETIYFLAAAEDTTSTYLDGEVLGSIIGTIDLKTMQLTNAIQISDKHKFEGLTLYSKSEKEISFLLCEDTDSELLESSIYKVTFPQKQ